MRISSYMSFVVFLCTIALAMPVRSQCLFPVPMHNSVVLNLSMALQAESAHKGLKGNLVGFSRQTFWFLTKLFNPAPGWGS